MTGSSDGLPGVVSWLPPPQGSPEQEFVEWANQLPPALDLNLVCTSMGVGTASFSVVEGPLSALPNGVIHGGIVAAMAAHCMGTVANASYAHGRKLAAASMHGQFQRPVVPPFRIDVDITAAGRTLIFVESCFVDAKGRRCSTFQSTTAVASADSRHSSDTRADADRSLPQG